VIVSSGATGSKCGGRAENYEKALRKVVRVENMFRRNKLFTIRDIVKGRRSGKEVSG